MPDTSASEEPAPEGLRQLDPLVLANGRRIALCETGDPDGEIAVYLHGTGSSRLEVGLYGAAAAAHGVRLVAWDRPGSGGSTRQPGRTVLDVVADTAAVVAHVGADRPVALGLSGGGSHVLALASAAPTVIRAGVALNPGPPSDDAVLALLPRQNRMVIGIARDHPRVFRLLVKPLEGDGGRLARAIQRRSFDPTDLEVLQRPEVVRYVVPATIEGKRQPHAFAADALTLWGAPWNVDLSTFQVPLHVFAGVRDPFCAFADSLGPAGAEIRHSPGGHLSFWVPDKLDEVMKVVAAG